MYDDLEETLGRELREVADRIQVPPMPVLPEEAGVRRRTRRHWPPLLVAAAVVLIVSGAVAVGKTVGGRDERQPAPPAASPSEEPVTQIPTTAPTVPYVVDRKLYVGENRVPGEWWSVSPTEHAWLAQGTDNTWWWGRRTQANKIDHLLDVPPVISPNGKYVAMVASENGRSVVTGFATRRGGQGMGAVPVYPGKAGAGDPVRVRAVTDDGKVLVQGSRTNLLWLPLGDNSTVDLNPTPDSAPAPATAPTQLVLGGTPAGLIVVDAAEGTDGSSGQPYLATISAAGEFTRLDSLPPHDDLAISPSGWLVWSEPGTLGGEVSSVGTLQVQSLDGAGRATLTAPQGWGFRVMAWAWEDGQHLIAPVVRDGGRGGERMVRCSARPARCVLIDRP